jgi:hypothetical protein
MSIVPAEVSEPEVVMLPEPVVPEVSVVPVLADVLVLAVTFTLVPVVTPVEPMSEPEPDWVVPIEVPEVTAVVACATVPSVAAIANAGASAIAHTPRTAILIGFIE